MGRRVMCESPTTLSTTLAHPQWQGAHHFSGETALLRGVDAELWNGTVKTGRRCSEGLHGKSFQVHPRACDTAAAPPQLQTDRPVGAQRVRDSEPWAVYNVAFNSQRLLCNPEQVPTTAQLYLLRDWVGF